MTKIKLLFFVIIFSALSIVPVGAQQILDTLDVIYNDNTSDGNTGATGTLMNDPHYREFPPTIPLPNVDGWWTNTSVVYYGGNHRRASRYGSGNNSGARAEHYVNISTSDYYLVYHHMNSGNASANCYVRFWRFGEGTAADSFRYNMQYNNTPDGRGSWKPLGIIQLFGADSSLTVEFGLDSLGANTLRVDAVALVRSRAAGPDLEFGNRRFTRLLTDPVTGDTLINDNFYRDRSPFGFSETTFKWDSYTDRTEVLYNLGSAPLTVTGFQTQTNRFSVTTPVPFTIQPGGKKEIVVRFSPRGEETTIDTIKILSNDPLEPEAGLPVIGTGINYNFILNASVTGSEPHWNVPPPGGQQELIGTFLNSTASPWPYPIPGGNIGSIVNTGSDPNIAVIYKYNIPDTLSGSYFLEYSGPVGSSNAAQNVTVDVVTPFYSNPNPALGDTQRVEGFNSRISGVNWGRIGGNKVFQLNGGGQTSVRYTNPQQGVDLLRADLLRVRLVPIAPTVSTNLDPARLLTYGSVSIYDSIRQQQGNFRRNFIIGSNGETPLRIDSMWLSVGGNFFIDNLPQFPITLPAIDGEYVLHLSFLPDSIVAYRDTVWIKSNDPVDTLIRVRLSGQGVGTGITIDDSDPTTFIFPPNPIVWAGTPDPLNMDKWYSVLGSGINSNRLFTYIYFNPTSALEKVEWFPLFPSRPGGPANEIDSFDVFIVSATSSSISSPMAKYIVKHVAAGGPDTIFVNQNGTAQGGQVPSSGEVYLGRFQFLRGGYDFPGSGTVFGSIELQNDTAAVSKFYQDSVVNTARRDSFVLRADALILRQAGLPLGIFDPNLVPFQYELSQNFPNPFNPTTQIRFAIPQDSKTVLKVYDILGREIATLLKDELKPGYYSVEWDGKNNFGTPVATGMYIYRLTAGKFVETKKMILMK